MEEYGSKLEGEIPLEEAVARSLCKEEWLVPCHVEQMEDQYVGVTGKRLSPPGMS